MILTNYIVGFVVNLGVICHGLPVEPDKSAAIPHTDILILEVDNSNFLKAKGRQGRQDEGGDGGGEAGGEGAAEGALSAVGERVANNVIKVVSSALTGNLNGVFDGSFNLFGNPATRNRVEGFFETIVGGLVNAVVGSSTTTANPKVAVTNATTLRPNRPIIIEITQDASGTVQAAIRTGTVTPTVAGATSASAVSTAAAGVTDDDEEENDEEEDKARSNNGINYKNANALQTTT